MTILRVFPFFLLFLFSCHRKGQTTNIEQEALNVTDAPFLSGSLSLSNPEKPAHGYLLWLYDHTDFSAVQLSLDAAGKFQFATKKLRRDHIYSFFILAADSVFLAAVDFSSDRAGKNLFRYEGGEKAEIGNLQLVLNQLGQVDTENSLLTGTLDDGFTLLDTGLEIDQFTLPSAIESAACGVELVVSSPQILLNSFYLRASNTGAYNRDREQWSRLYCRLHAKAEKQIVRVNLIATSSWFESAREVDFVSSTYAQAVDWAAADYKLSATSGTLFEASAFVQKDLPTQQIIFLQVNIAAGESYQLPMQVGIGVKTPPFLTSISLTPGTTVAIDYSSSTDPNGLTRPFIYVDNDINLTLQPPQDLEDHDFLADRMGFIDLIFDYFHEENNALVETTIATTDYPEALQTKIELGSSVFATGSWDPSKRTLTLSLVEEAAKTVPHQIILDSRLFLHASSSVEKIRVTVLYRGNRNRAGSVIWFK